MTEPLLLLNAYRAFEATARLGSVRSAARELNVTDGAVSKQIKTLETALNTELFVRGHRQMHLTENAENLAKTLSSAFKTIIRATERYEKSVRNLNLVIAAPSTFIIRWLIPRVAGLENRIEGTHVSFTTWNRDIVPADRSIDIFVTVGNEQSIPGMARHIIGKEYFGPVISPKIWVEDNIASDLLKLPRLGVQWPPSMWSNWSEESGFKLRNENIIRYEKLLFAIGAAETGLGPVMAPTPAIFDAIMENRLVAPLGFQKRDGDWALNWRTERDSGLFRAVHSWFKAEFTKMETDLLL